MRQGTEQGDEISVTPEQLERERLITYLDWATVDIPTWWLIAYGAAIAAWIASYDLGGWWPLAASCAIVAVMVALVRVVTSRSGVSTPRFRGMPSPLMRTYLAPAAAVVGSAGAWVVLLLTTDDVPYALLGIGVGAALSGSLAWQARRCRIVAARIAAEEGIDR